MKNTLLILSLSSMLISCSSINTNQEKTEYLDLINDYDQSIFDTHWKINERVNPKYPMKAAMKKVMFQSIKSINLIQKDYLMKALKPH